MNLKKMAENYVDPLSADFDCIPYSPIFLNELEAAYKAGAQAVLDKVKPVLEYYAQPDHYEEQITLSGVRKPGVLTESGDKARALLEELK